MKRGFVGLIALVLLLILPGVSAADSIASLFFGSTQESILFLRLIYAALVFIIFLKASRDSVFKEEKQAKLANVFSLILAFFAMRFTPESVLTTFGWVIMLIAPLMILYKLSGSVIKTEKDKFSWLRFILAIIGTLFIFLALGSYSGFSSSIGGTPLVGGFFDELFAGLNYFIFYKLSWFFILAGVVILLFLLFSVISKFTGTSSATPGTPSTGFKSSFGKGLLAILLIAAAIALIGWLMGGLAFAPLAGIFGALSQYLYYALIALGIILFTYLFFRFRGWMIFVWFWRAFMWILGAIGRTTRVIVGGVAGAASSNNLFVILQTPTQTLPHRNAGRARDPINVNPGSITPFLFTAYRGRFRATASRLENAAFIFRVNNGALTPTTGNTNNRGELRTVYSAPGAIGLATMQVQVTHPSIPPTTVIQDYQINIGAMGPVLDVFIPAIAPINIGNAADIIIEVTDGAGNGVNGANVEIIFPGIAGIRPMIGMSAAGAAGRPATFTARTPAFPRAGTFDFVVNVRAPAGFRNPPPAYNAVVVNNPTVPSLTMTDLAGTIAGVRTAAPGPFRITVGQTMDIDLLVRTTATMPATPTDRAAITITPALRGMINPTRRGAGLYAGTFTPTAANMGMNHLVVEAQLAGHNDAIGYIDIEVLPSARTPAMRVIVNWVPDPSTSNRYMLMNFTVVDNAAITPIAGATITVNARPALNISGGNVQTTNARGQLNTDMRLITMGPVPRGTVQRFGLAITVIHAAYPAKTSGPIIVNFGAPGARIGGPQSITF